MRGLGTADGAMEAPDSHPRTSGPLVAWPHRGRARVRLLSLPRPWGRAVDHDTTNRSVRGHAMRPGETGPQPGARALAKARHGLAPCPAGQQQAPKGTSIRRTSRNLGSPTPPYLVRGRDNASVWEGWHRRRSSPTPGCNGLDMVKGRQEEKMGRQDGPCSHRGHRRGLCP